MAPLSPARRMAFLIIVSISALFILMQRILRSDFSATSTGNPPKVILTPPEISDDSQMIESPSHPSTPPRRVLFFGYCRHYHDFDAQFANYSVQSLPNSEFHLINLDELHLNESMAQLNQYAITTYSLTPHIDKWQWTLWPTCGQYKNNLYLTQRNLIKSSKVFYHSSDKSLSSWSSKFNAKYSNPPFITYPVTESRQSVVDQWHNDVYWPKGAHTLPLSYPPRALIVAMSGEVFWESDYGPGENIDFELMRSRAYPKTMAFTGIANRSLHGTVNLTGHWLQSAKGFYRKSYNRDDRSLQLLETEYASRSDEDWDLIYANKTDFCVMIVKSVYKRGQYFPDALVRHSMFRLLSEQYKQCHSRGQSYLVPDGIERCSDSLGDIGTFLCMKPYKFAITMENTLKAGYMSEKIFNGIFADTVPIYFGLPDVKRYNINMDRFVYCNVSEEVIMKMRSMQIQHGKKWNIPGLNESPSDEQLIEWAMEQSKDELMPCIEEIKELDQDKEKWINKAKQSIFKSGTTAMSEFDGYTLGLGFADVLRTLKSYIFEDIE